MSKYTTEEIENAVAEREEGDGWFDLDWAENGHKVKVTLQGEETEVEKVDGKPSAEGGGEHVYIILKAGDQFFEKTGYYASHYGTDWDGDVTEVRPVEKTMTVYEAV